MFLHLNQGNEDGGFLITKPLLMNLIFGINLPRVTLISALSQLSIPSLNNEKFEKNHTGTNFISCHLSTIVCLKMAFNAPNSPKKTLTFTLIFGQKQKKDPTTLLIASNECNEATFKLSQRASSGT